MSSEEAQQIFKRLMMKSREDTISNFAGYFNGRYKSSHAQAIRGFYESFSAEERESISRLVPFIVDETLIVFLQSLDHLALIDGKIDIIIRVNRDDKDGVPIYDYTDSLGLDYEDDWVGDIGKAGTSQRHRDDS